MSLLNANVFFELGIRTAVDKPVALVRDSLTKRIPFDTSLINHHTYSASVVPWLLADEVRRLSDHLRSAVNTSNKRNSLWGYFGLTTRADRPAEGSVDEKLDAIVRLLDQGSRATMGAETPNTAPPPGMDQYSDEYAALTAAQALARTLSAEFTVKDFGDGRLVLDLGTYQIGAELEAAIRAAGLALGVEVSIESDKPESAAED